MPFGFVQQYAWPTLIVHSLYHQAMWPCQQTRGVEQCYVDVCPPSSTLAQHQPNIGCTYLVGAVILLPLWLNTPRVGDTCSKLTYSYVFRCVLAAYQNDIVTRHMKHIPLVKIWWTVVKGGPTSATSVCYVEVSIVVQNEIVSPF